MQAKSPAPLSIPVEVCRGDSPPGETTMAILHELARMLETLASAGEVDSMDLRNSPLAPHERRALKETLGRGEVRAEVAISGPTRIYETAVPGIWWITHCGDDDRVLGEFIEVTRCPDILRSQSEELSTAATRLRARFGGPGLRAKETAPEPGDVDRGSIM